MIVDHVGSLYVGVADCRAQELNAPLAEILAQRIGFRAVGGIIRQSAASILGRTRGEPNWVALARGHTGRGRVGASGQGKANHLW